jgi:hypothetical protein
MNGLLDKLAKKVLQKLEKKKKNRENGRMNAYTDLK